MGNRRRKLLINIDKQRRFITSAVLIAITIINLLFVITFLAKPHLMENIDIAETLALLGVEIIVIILISSISLRLSHRFVGPAYAITRDLANMANGDLTTQTQLRKGDFYGDIGSSLSSTAAKLCNQIKAVKSIAENISQSCDGNEDIQRLSNELNDELAYFTTEEITSDDSSPDQESSPEIRS